MYSIKCEQCGKCCIEFSHQVHYNEKELETLFLKQKATTHQLFQLFLSIKDTFMMKVNEKIEYFIPIKKDIIRLVPPDKL